MLDANLRIPFEDKTANFVRQTAWPEAIIEEGIMRLVAYTCKGADCFYLYL